MISPRPIYKRVRVDGEDWLEHRLVWTNAYGVIPAGWVVHHINGDTLDNRLENLACMPRGKHQQLHAPFGPWTFMDEDAIARHYELSVEALRKRSIRHNAPEGMSWCPKCQDFLPLSEFGVAKARKLGVTVFCKKHSSEDARSKRAQQTQEHIDNNPDFIHRYKNKWAPEGMAWCCVHQSYLPRDRFFNSKQRLNGLEGMCKDCKQERRRKLAEQRGYWNKKPLPSE